MKASETVFLVFLIVITLCLVNAQPIGAAENSWTTKASMPTARSALGVAVLNGKIYAIGGWNGSWGALAVNEEYDTVTNTWTTKKPVPTPRYGFGIAVVENKIYVIGGSTGDYTRTGVNEVYNPLTDTWETKTPMPITPRRPISANVVGGRICVIEYSSDSRVKVYDPATDTWATKTPIPNFPDEPYATATSAVVDDKIYIIASFMEEDHIQYSNQIYDPKTDTWSRGAPLPTYAGGATAAATTGVAAPKRIYVMGGRGFTTGPPLATVRLNQIYDPERNNWSMGPYMPTSRESPAVAVVDDVLYAIGGYHSEIMYHPPAYLTGANEQYTPVGYGTVPPKISVVSPENKTYPVNHVSVDFTMSKPTSWIGFSLDGQDNVTITGNTTLAGLSNGLHNLTVYANDAAGNTGASETVYFTIAQQSESFPTIWVVAAMYMIAAGVAFLIYFVKVKKTHRKAEKTMPEAET